MDMGTGTRPGQRGRGLTLRGWKVPDSLQYLLKRDLRDRIGDFPRIQPNPRTTPARSGHNCHGLAPPDPQSGPVVSARRPIASGDA